MNRLLKTPRRAASCAPASTATSARALLLLLGIALTTTGCSNWGVVRAAHTATGFASHVLCNEVFITGSALERAFDARIRPMPGQGLVLWALAPQADLARQEISVRLAGGFERRARYTDLQGCQVLLDRDAHNTTTSKTAGAPSSTATLGRNVPVAPATPAADPSPDADGPSPVSAATPALFAALQRALPQPADVHHTRAVVVLHHGRLVAERYAQGVGPQTPMLGFSASKSVTNALIGILVHQGRLDLQGRAVLPSWQDPADPRHAITIEQLLRHTSGLDLLQNNSGFDASTQIMFSVRDKAAAAMAAPLAAAPGSRWAYADTNYLLLSRVLRDAVGGQDDAVRQFMQAELFSPVGMRRARMDIDATGTGMGAAHVSATARDWARFGQLFLDDGVVQGRRILPAGWVQRSTTLTATPTQLAGYGAGWWTNRVAGHVPGWGVPWGLPDAPADTYFARGFQGQFVVVVPSRRLVLVRLSASHQRGDDIAETNRIVADVLAAIAD